MLFALELARLSSKGKVLWECRKQHSEAKGSSALLCRPFLIPSAALLTEDFAAFAAASLFLLERHFTTCMWQQQPPKVIFLPALSTIGPWQNSISQPTQLWGQEHGWSRLPLPRATWAPPQCSQLQQTVLVGLVPLGTTVSPVRSH